MSRKANYGIDAPGVVLRLGLIGLAAVAAGLACAGPLTEGVGPPGLSRALAYMFFWPGGWLLLTAGVMLWGSKVGKLRLRDRLLDGLVWQGDERVLDVGCGHGLMLLGAARRAPRGRAFGIELWQGEDQAHNSAAATMENARLEGVADRVELIEADARSIPLADGTFDVILSSWAIHNIYDAAGRSRALGEMARVLKPGGRMIVVDIRHTGEYARAIEATGMKGVRRSGPVFTFFIPSRAVFAAKVGGVAACLS